MIRFGIKRKDDGGGHRTRRRGRDRQRDRQRMVGEIGGGRGRGARQIDRTTEGEGERGDGGTVKNRRTC